MQPDRHPSFCVLGYSEAAMLLRSPQAPAIGAAVCIHGQRDPTLELVCDRRLDLRFDDCPAYPGNDPLSTYRRRLQARKAAEIGLQLRGPEPAHVQEIIAFADQTREEERLILFQCHAGISRSAAAAFINLCCWLGDGEEELALATLRHIRPAAQPNRDLVTMADELMARKGRMLDVIQRQI